MDNMYVNEKSYKVIKLLGHGKGGYSYLVTDGVKEYVLKQIFEVFPDILLLHK